MSLAISFQETLRSRDGSTLLEKPHPLQTAGQGQDLVR